MDAGDHRHLERLDPVEQRMRPVERRLQHAGVGHVVELGDVSPGDEAAFLARQQHHALELARRRQLLEPRNDPHQLRQRLTAQRVHRSIGHIDGEPADPLEIEVETPGAA